MMYMYIDFQGRCCSFFNVVNYDPGERLQVGAGLSHGGPQRDETGNADGAEVQARSSDTHRG